MTDGEDSFLSIGHRLGWLGLEHESHATLSELQVPRDRSVSPEEARRSRFSGTARTSVRAGYSTAGTITPIASRH
jgi:hypothetical protein